MTHLTSHVKSIGNFGKLGILAVEPKYLGNPHLGDQCLTLALAFEPEKTDPHWCYIGVLEQFLAEEITWIASNRAILRRTIPQPIRDPNGLVRSLANKLTGSLGYLEDLYRRKKTWYWMKKEEIIMLPLMVQHEYYAALHERMLAKVDAEDLYRQLVELLLDLDRHFLEEVLNREDQNGDYWQSFSHTDMCTCGHRRDQHVAGDHRCLDPMCYCRLFISTTGNTLYQK